MLAEAVVSGKVDKLEPRLAALLRGIATDTAELVADAFLGYGQKGPPSGEVATLIRRATAAPLLALDVPSGLELETARPTRPRREPRDTDARKETIHLRDLRLADRSRPSSGKPPLLARRRPTVLDVVLEIVEGLLSFARKPEAQRNGEQPTDDPGHLHGRIDTHTGAVITERGHLPAIPRLRDKHRKAGAGVRQRSRPLIQDKDGLLDVRKHPHTCLTHSTVCRSTRVGAPLKRTRRGDRRRPITNLREVMRNNVPDPVGWRVNDRLV